MEIETIEGLALIRERIKGYFPEGSREWVRLSLEEKLLESPIGVFTDNGFGVAAPYYVDRSMIGLLDSYGWEGLIYVSPLYRRQGIGEQLLQALPLYRDGLAVQFKAVGEGGYFFLSKMVSKGWLTKDNLSPNDWAKVSTLPKRIWISNFFEGK